MSPDPLDTSAGIPYEHLATLRAECPVSQTASGAYYLARYEDVLAATKNLDAFPASFREPGVVVPPEEQLISEIPEPRHGQVRRIINSAIAQHRIGRVEPFARETCHGLLDGLLERGGGDLVAEYVMPIPAQVIAHLLGADPADHHRFAEWSDLVVQSTYATKNRREDGVDGEGLAGVAPEFTAYLDRMIAERRTAADPPDDFVTRLLHTEVDGQRLTDLEMRTQLAFLLMAGNETTRHLIANMLETVCADPALLTRLRAERDLVPTVVEESLRHDPPIHVLMRDCPHGAEVDGTTIPAGVKVAFGLASANRDERMYDDPDAFKLDRPSARDHLAFGGGPHVCPGAALARLEGRIALEVFLDRVENAQLDDGYTREPVPVFWANGPRTLPVTLTAAAPDHM
ncbi:MAG: cytochrome P450 [Acidimicrobiia bacterium]